MLSHLNAYALLKKSIHTEHDETKDALTGIKINVEKILQNQKQALTSTHMPIIQRQDKLEVKVNDMCGHLTEVQNTMELLVSIQLVDNAKKWEKLSKSKCRPSLYY